MGNWEQKGRGKGRGRNGGKCKINLGIILVIGNSQPYFTSTGLQPIRINWRHSLVTLVTSMEQLPHSAHLLQPCTSNFTVSCISSTHCALYSFIRLSFLETTWSQNKTKPVSLEMRLDHLVWERDQTTNEEVSKIRLFDEHSVQTFAYCTDMNLFPPERSISSSIPGPPSGSAGNRVHHCSTSIMTVHE